MTKAKETPSFDVGGFDEFRARAQDGSMSRNEKVGFPDSYRDGKSQVILSDILAKIPRLRSSGASVLDIGPGCSDLSATFIDFCLEQSHQIILVDSQEMLDQLPNAEHAAKIPGAFPANIRAIKEKCATFDAILVYSVAQYVFAEANLWSFVDQLASLLAEGGALLIGDIPNASRRKRFLGSATGRRYHQQHYPNDPMPTVSFNTPELSQIDDAVVLGLVARMRLAGYDAFLVPQGHDLPMANRREDIVIYRP